MSNWYRYDWALSGEPAEFHVDLAYLDEFDTLGDFTTLLYVSCYSLYADATAFTQREKTQLDAVLRTCLDVLDKKAVYVGYIDVTAQRRYYFYTSDARLLVPLIKACGDERNFRVECVKVAEPNRQTYYRLLAPDRAKMQSSDNLAYIRSLRERGDDCAAMRRVNLHLCFPGEQSRAAFRTEARAMGFALGAESYVPERELPFSLTVHRICPLEPATVTALTTQAIHAAEACGGTMERFDAAFVPKRGWLR